MGGAEPDRQEILKETQAQETALDAIGSALEDMKSMGRVSWPLQPRNKQHRFPNNMTILSNEGQTQHHRNHTCFWMMQQLVLGSTPRYQALSMQNDLLLSHS